MFIYAPRIYAYIYAPCIHTPLVYMYIYVPYIHVYIRPCIHVYIRPCIHVYIHPMYTCIYIYLCASMYTPHVCMCKYAPCTGIFTRPMYQSRW